MKPWKKWAIIGLFASTIAATTYIYASARNPEEIKVKVETVRRGDMSSYLSTSGTIQSTNRKDHFVYSAAKIEKVYVDIGDRVKKNELLVKFEVPDLEPQLKQAYIQLDIAETTLESLKKQKSETKTGTVPMIPGMASIDMTGSGDLDSRIKLQEKQVELARINVNVLKDKIKDAQSEIKSTISGVVTGINGVDGGIASPGMPVITVEDTDRVKAVLNVTQYDVLKIREGQEVIVKLGDEEKEYKGRVDKISPTARKVIMGAGTAASISSETAIPVEVAILDGDDGVRIGFDVDAVIKVNSKSNVLYVPDEAVISDKDRNYRVFVVQDNKAVLKNVEIGMESDFYIEITSGLSEGERVIVSPPPGLRSGSIVRIADGGEQK